MKPQCEPIGMGTASFIARKYTTRSMHISVDGPGMCSSNSIISEENLHGHKEILALPVHFDYLDSLGELHFTKYEEALSGHHSDLKGHSFTRRVVTCFRRSFI